MPAPEEGMLRVLREWVEKAENDLTAAVQILKLGKVAPTDTVCFHAQQCVEKYLKAILVYRAIPVPKMHDIQVLMKLVPPRCRPQLTVAQQKQVTTYAAVTRYPEAGLDIVLAEARRAVAVARRVRRAVRRVLPKAALRRKK
jgi:HEPN domain-containing protein